MQAELKTTPLIKVHRSLGAKLAPFGGWLMPIQYTGIIAEHNWTRYSCSLFDICHMGEFIIYGKSDKSNLEKIITVNLTKMPVNSCRYGFMLQDNGGIVDDVIIYKLREDKWMIVVNAANIDTDEAHLRNYLSKECKLENVSDRLGKLDLQGRFSRSILKEIAGNNIIKLKYYAFDYFMFLGEKSIISRTGYTGELGYELYLSSKNIESLWNLLLKNDKVRAAGLGARNTLRLEMCLPLYGQDIDRDTTPKEAGLEKFVDFNKDFIGKNALVKKKKEGKVGRQLAYFITDSRRAPRSGYKIYSQGKNVGIVTSGSFSPSLLYGIGMGYIELSYNQIGNRITLKESNIEIEAKIVNKPFYRNGSLKE